MQNEISTLSSRRGASIALLTEGLAQTVPALVVRLIHASDRKLLQESFLALSPQTRYQRFHGTFADLPDPLARYLTDIDGIDHYAIAIFEEGMPESVSSGVGVARFIRDHRAPDRAELAITLTDRMQGRGLARPIMRFVAGAARLRGIRVFTMFIQPDNHRALRFLRRLGASVVRREGSTGGFWLPVEALLRSPPLQDGATSAQRKPARQTSKR
jgi:RimJ/RimL family protein N-acetyltransferase